MWVASTPLVLREEALYTSLSCIKFAVWKAGPFLRLSKYGWPPAWAVGWTNDRIEKVLTNRHENLGRRR